uniref:Bromodomain and WD repeat-containing protein 1-like n=1 Tax=Rhizophora mucronata TaxID=61149 RepID=A0A2P2NZ06_RHIMU
MNPLLHFISTHAYIEVWLYHTFGHINYSLRFTSSNIFRIKLCIFTYLVSRLLNF